MYNHFYDVNDNLSEKTVLFEKINEYIKICRDDILLNKVNNKNKSPPKITSIIPVYNAVKTIKTTIRSIQNQKMAEIEILLIDDVSTDNSIDIIYKEIDA